MNGNQPIFTEKTACQDCYRCLRNCPVKAIKIEQGAASVVEDLCIYCGKCVTSCPANAKKVRDDCQRVYEILAGGAKVMASLAPSYITEFADVNEQQMVGALQRLGFSGVSETALGAEEVSQNVRTLIATKGNRTWISSACPAVVKYIQRYHPSLTKNLTPFYSPMQVHALLLKKLYPGVKVVFIGPCIGKKSEADEFDGGADAVLTFDNIRQMFKEKRIPLNSGIRSTAGFVPRSACNGKLYPIDGGMIAGIRNDCTVSDRAAMHFSGMDEVAAAIRSVEADKGTSPIFLELLACPGGCISGPVTSREKGALTKRLLVIGKEDVRQPDAAALSGIEITTTMSALTKTTIDPSGHQIVEALRECGKYSEKDELNCGGCGYGNCRELARAIVAGNAEAAMCVTYMRQLALKKANKLISSMPSGVVIVDRNLRIIECNRRFAALGGEDSVYIYNEVPGMAGAELDKVLPVGHLFRHVFSAGEEIFDREIVLGKRILKCNIFTIENTVSAGGIFSDITAPEIKREEVIKKAQAVIRKNLSTVQKIAFLLGENASETEMVLNSIIDSYKPSHHGRHDDA